MYSVNRTFETVLGYC